MKFRHMLAVMIVVAVALGTAGCEGKYSFIFKDQQDLKDANGEWTVRENPDYCSFVPEGLMILDVNVACPKKFKGDFTLSVYFDLMADDAHRYNFGIIVCDGDFYFGSDNDIHADFQTVGSNQANFQLYEHDNTTNVYHNTSVNSTLLFDKLVLGYGGENLFVINKLGDTITLSINGSQFAQFQLEAYASDWFCPNIYAYNSDTRDEDYGLLLRSAFVEYDGSMVNR